MGKRFIIVLVVFLLVIVGACGRKQASYEQPYQPVGFTGEDPLQVIKSAIELQPPTYAAVPKTVEVTREYIRIVAVDSGWRGPFGWAAPARPGFDAENIIRFEHIGSVKLYKTDVWWAELKDPAGNYLYSVYSFREDRAKRFVDAVTMMMSQSR